MIFDSLIEQGLISKDSVKEMNQLGNVIYNFLYFGHSWQEISNQTDNGLTIDKATERFLEIYNENEILENTFYLDKDCEFVTINEPLFNEDEFISDNKEMFDECCCELSRQSLLNDHRDMFYQCWYEISCSQLFKDFLGPDTYSYIF